MQNPTYRIPADSVFAKRVKDEVVLLSLTTGYYFTLNQIGSDIWRMLEAGQSVQSMIESLKGLYDMDESTISNDVSQLLTALVEEQLLSVDQPQKD